MLVKNKHYKSIWINPADKSSVFVIDQNELPYRLSIKSLRTLQDVITAIKNMTVRGAPLIGITSVFGLYFALTELAGKYRNKQITSEYLQRVYKKLINTRPTAINLKILLDRAIAVIKAKGCTADKVNACFEMANKLIDEDININKRIGIAGAKLLKKIKGRKKILNILTHCNAGWLATADYGTALAPVYMSFMNGMNIHVWVEETRPRNQGSRLTAWELYNMNIPHTVITDNAGGYVMQKGLVDVVIVGADRTAINGDVCNKIGTYKTALSAFDNKIPFYAAVPYYSFDFDISNPLEEIPIEERNNDEVEFMEGKSGNRRIKLRAGNQNSNYRNFGFDITPARLITGLITDKGVIKPSFKSILKIKNPGYF